MKLAILATFLFLAAVSALPVVEVKEGDNSEGKQLVKGESTLIGAAPPMQADAEKKQLEDDLKTDATFWGGWGGYGHYGYGGWGGYYSPYYTTHYYASYPTYYYKYFW